MFSLTEDSLSIFQLPFAPVGAEGERQIYLQPFTTRSTNSVPRERVGRAPAALSGSLRALGRHKKRRTHKSRKLLALDNGRPKEKRRAIWQSQTYTAELNTREEL